MSTILARRLKGTKARPVLVQEQYTPEALSVDLWALKADHAAVKEQAWHKCDCGCQDSVASTSSSTSSLSSSPSSPSSDEADSMFCVTPDHEQPPPTPSTSCSSIISSSSMCEETEECWTEHAYIIEDASRPQSFEQSRKEPARRSRPSRSSRPSSAASASQSRTSATANSSSSAASSFRPSARSSRRKQVPSSSPPYSSSSSEEDEELHFVRTARPRRSKRLNAYDCDCDGASQKFGRPASPRPQSLQLRPVIETRLRTSVNPQFYLIYSLENVMMQERKIRYPLKDRATYTSFANCKGISLSSPLSRQVSVA